MIQRSVLEDKSQRVTEIVLSSMSATRFFAGKILGIGAVGLTQYFAWFLLAVIAYLLLALGGGFLPEGAQLGLKEIPALQPVTYLYFVIFYVLGFLLYAGLLASVGAMSTTDQEAQQLMQPLVMLMVVPLAGMIYFLQHPDSTASVVLSLIPLFAPLVMFMRINVSSPPLWQILASLAILAASVVLVFWISGRIFRVGILMTGKKASLAEAWHWVRQA
jgi:ABC-2 type transport system permease protein